MNIKFSVNNSGATAVEYALILSLLFLVIFGSLNYFSSSTGGLYTSVASQVNSATGL
jgi:pilus assembly protein Flp/PilA